MPVASFVFTKEGQVNLGGFDSDCHPETCRWLVHTAASSRFKAWP